MSTGSITDLLYKWNGLLPMPILLAFIDGFIFGNKAAYVGPGSAKAKHV